MLFKAKKCPCSKRWDFNLATRFFGIVQFDIFPRPILVPGPTVFQLLHRRRGRRRRGRRRKSETEDSGRGRPLLPPHHVHHHLLHAVRLRLHGGRCCQVKLLTDVAFCYLIKGCKLKLLVDNWLKCSVLTRLLSPCYAYSSL